MNIAYKEAIKSFNKNEIPVGCVIVYKNKIIAKGSNLKEKKHNVLKHAELVAIDRACAKLKFWRLDECVIYTTLEPCMMCTGAIVESRIKTVFYGTKSKSKQMFDVNKLGGVKFICLNDDKCSKILSDFFKNKRKNK